MCWQLQFLFQISEKCLIIKLFFVFVIYILTFAPRDRNKSIRDKEQSFECLDFDSSLQSKLQNTTPEHILHGIGEMTWSRQW